MRRSAKLAAALAVALTATGPTTAMAGPHDEAIADIIDAAVTEWTILLSCSVLDRETHEAIQELWADEREEVEELLEDAEVAPELAAEFNARLAPDQLMEVTRGDAQTLIALCSDTPWRQNMAMFRILLPATEIEGLL